MATIPTNNPAGRLLSLMKAAMAAGHNRSMREGWTDVLGLRQDCPDGEFLRHYAGAVRLCDETVRQLESAGAHSLEMVKREMGYIRAGFAVTYLGGNSSALHTQFRPTGMQALEFAAMELGAVSTEDQIADDELRALQGEVQDLINRITDAPIDADLKKWLLRLLLKVHDALLRYRVEGAEVLRDVVEAAAGAKLTEPRRTWDRVTIDYLDRTRNVILALCGLVAAATTAARLDYSPLQRLLEEKIVIEHVATDDRMLPPPGTNAEAGGVD